MLSEYGHQALYFDFGSFEKPVHYSRRTDRLQALAPMIDGRMQANESIRTRTHFRQMYNWNTVYRRYYEPVLKEACPDG